MIDMGTPVVTLVKPKSTFVGIAYQVSLWCVSGVLNWREEYIEAGPSKWLVSVRCTDKPVSTADSCRASWLAMWLLD